MKRFSALYQALDTTPRTHEKVEAVADYFTTAPPRDAAWALYFLTGRKLPRGVTTTQLRAWAGEASGLPAWLVEECYEAVGDLAETVALVLPQSREASPLPLHVLVEEGLRTLPHLNEPGRRAWLMQTWRQLGPAERFLCNKLITGGFRIGVQRALVARALARVANLPAAVISHRLMGAWEPTEDTYHRLLSRENIDRDPAQPYPFFLANPLDQDPALLGPAQDWQAEWKWDGVRAQLIHRQGQVLLWSRGEELVSPAFPEIVQAARLLPDGTVLDGELLAWSDGVPLAFSQLQRRLGRKSASLNLQRQAPVCFMTYDLLELQGQDVRSEALSQRRAHLESLLVRLPPGTSPPARHGEGPVLRQDELFPELDLSPTRSRSQQPSQATRPIQLSQILPWTAWSDLPQLMAQARARGVEGLMLKQKSAPYGVGRQRGAWWKWKVDPLHIDAVLVAAQPGHGRRASLYTDYTFAVWHHQELLTVAKAYSGLTDEEIRQVDAFVRENTVERKGPVRLVKPELVFELAFDGLQPSSRHKAGLALRFPRMARWRHDKKAGDADSLETVSSLLRTPADPAPDTSQHVHQ